MKKELKIIGKPTPKLDAKIRVSGEAVYGQDVVLPNMLHGAILRTEHPVAEIESIDTSKASQLPGVICVITAEDVDTNNINFLRDHPILKKGEVNCIRDEIAAVAAEKKEIALEALKLIEVKYKVKDGVFDPFEALKEDTPQLNKFAPSNLNKNIAMTFHYEHGDLQEQKEKSVCIVTNRYTLPRVTHCCLGTCAITADYSKTEKRLTLYCVTQVPFLYQRDMAHALKMEPSNIRVIQTVIGGGFGSKLDMYPYEPICALLSMKTGQPVQITYDREEEFIASPTRQPMVIDLITGVDEKNKFTFREVKIIMDNGAYTSWGATTPFVMMQTFSSLYQLPACVFDADAVYTNNPFAGSFRGYGNPQATFAIERNIDLMAEKLGMDKAEIRLINANFKGEITGQGLRFKTCGHKDALKTVIDKSGRRKKKGNGFGRYKRGIGFASMLHVGGGAKIYPSDGCGTTVKLDDFGYLTIITGSSEIGQGSETVLAMIASEELGIDMKNIRVINTDTDVKPWDVGVHASRTTFVAGNSALGATRKLRDKLSKKAAQLLNTNIDDLEYENGQIKSCKTGDSIKIDKAVREIHFKEPSELCIESYYYEPDSEFQDKGFKGNVSSTYAFASQAIEVEVDTYTGNVRVLDIHVAQDIGRVLNPLGLAGQIEGGVIMGMGYALTEELLVEKGRVLNPSFHDYKLPLAGDIPDIHFYPIETYDPKGPYGAKGVGEAPLIPTAPAIANAVSDAIGIKIDDLPITPEKVLKALKNNTTIQQYNNITIKQYNNKTVNFNVISPETTKELLGEISKHQDKNFRFGAGCTDLLLELKKQPDEDLTVINLAHLNDNRFTSISKCDDGIRIGALVTANGILYNKRLRKQYPVLFEAANRLASAQIRQVATIGGNLCTASPAGDFACALSALEARCEILNAGGNVRIIPIDNFFIDVRKTDLNKDEILCSIVIPSNSETTKPYSNFVKVGTRKSMEIAVVSLAYHIQADGNDEITKAGVAIGSVAPTVKFVKSACEFLIGRNFSSIRSSEAERFAARVLEYASPISDIRASAWYRKEALFNISRSIFDK